MRLKLPARERPRVFPKGGEHGDGDDIKGTRDSKEIAGRKYDEELQEKEEHGKEENNTIVFVRSPALFFSTPRSPFIPRLVVRSLGRFVFGLLPLFEFVI